MNLEIKNLTKSYGDVKALDDFNIVLKPGIYGLLGPNGAGKSTLMNILSLLLKKDKGEILFNGRNIETNKKEYLSKIAYMPQINCLYEDFTLRENIYYIGALKNIDRNTIKKECLDIVAKVGLIDIIDKKIKYFSGGMKQRAMFAQTLINHPEILILDEPTAGLDPEKRIELRNLIATLSKDSIVLIATHVVSDVEFIANEIILLNKGQIIAKGSIYDLISSIKDKVFEIEMHENNIKEMEEKESVANLRYVNNKLVARIIKKSGDDIRGKAVEPTLNDVYLYYFGKNTS